MEIIKKYWKLLLVGLLVRIILGGITYHPDLKAQLIPGIVLFKFHELDVYEYANWVTPKEVMDKPPMAYVIPLVFQLPIRPFITDQFENDFFENRQSLFGHPAVWLYMLYGKLPLFVFDLALAILLATLVDVSQRKKIIILWLFNPMTLWATAAIGQVDIYTTFFMVLSFYLVKKNNLKLSALSLGLGAAIKSVPLLILPFILSLSKSWLERISMVILAVAPFVLTALPFIHSAKFKENALLAPQLSKSLYAVMPLSGSENLFIVVVILGFIYLLYFSKVRGLYDYLVFSLSTILIVLSFTHFHIQWFLWVTPFLILLFLKHWTFVEQLITLGFSISLTMMLFLFDSSLQLKLLAPLFPSLDQARGLLEVLNSNQIIFLRSLSASIFAATSFFLIFWVFKIYKDD